jgi:hypothetical protein
MADKTKGIAAARLKQAIAEKEAQRREKQESKARQQKERAEKQQADRDRAQDEVAQMHNERHVKMAGIGFRSVSDDQAAPQDDDDN